MKKRITLFGLLIVFAFSSNAQFVSRRLSKVDILPEQTVSVILSANETINSVLKESIKLYWKKCKYEFLTLDEVADRGKLGDYYLAVTDVDGGGGSGYSSNAAYTAFGISNNDISEACKKYKKTKHAYDLSSKLSLENLVGAFLDPRLINNNPLNGSGLTIKVGGSDYANFAIKDFSNAVMVNIKTINWLLTEDMEKYFKKEKGSGPMDAATERFNSNACELKKMTLFIPSTDAVKRQAPDYLGKDFDINEFKEYYEYNVKIETPEKIMQLIKSDKENKYAMLVQGVYGRSPLVLVLRLSDGAVLFGSFIANSSAPGYSTRAYKQFKDLCK